MITLLLVSVSAFAAKAPTWEQMLTTDDVTIEKFEENAPNGQHNKFNFMVRFTPTKGKQTTETLIKDLQEDWIESHSEYGFNDGILDIRIKGTDLIDKGNGFTEQKPFEIKKCFKLNATSTSFASVKCP